MKKTTLIMIASASMLFATPAMDRQTKGKQCQSIKTQMAQGNKCCNRKVNSPFLIKSGLPHLSKMIMPYMNDPAFNITAEQEKKLAQVRKNTMKTILEAKSKIIVLRKDIISASQSGVNSDMLKEKVAKLALLEAAATLTHLKCIEETKKILTKDQLLFLLVNKNKWVKQNKCNKRMRRNR